jgi:Zn-finger nucleic acid-binding protein
MELTCPKCQGTMRSYERNGVTIDQCSECRGIFLDRGELERLVDAESAWSSERAERSAPPGPPREQHYSDSHQQSSGYPRKKKKESFFEELFG